MVLDTESLGKVYTRSRCHQKQLRRLSSETSFQLLVEYMTYEIHDCRVYSRAI